MRKLIALLTIFSFNAYAAAPTGIGGEQGQLSYTNNLKAPNYQITSLGGVNSRIESGNTNLLMNPSFEHKTVTTGWTATGISAATAETSIVVEGKQSLKMVLNSTLSAYQDSTVNAAQLSGLQGVASIKVKTSDVSGLKACVRNAGVTSSTLCVNIPADGTWKHISIPFIMTATSNGVALTSTGTSGTVYVDDAFVGTSAPFQDVSGAKLIGSLKYAKTSGCTWSTTSTTYAVFAAQASCPTPTVTGSASAPATKIPGITFSSLPPGDYQIIAKARYGGTTSALAMNSQYRFSDGVNDYNEIVGGQSGVNTIATGYFLNTISDKVSYSTTQSNITLQIKGLTSNASNATVIDAASLNDFVIEVYYFPPATKIYSQASQDYDWTAYTPTFGAGFGTVTNPNCYHQRRGHNLSVICFPTSGTTTAAIGSISLPSGLAIDSNVIKATNTTSAAGQIVGEYNSSTGGSNNAWIVTAMGTSTSNVYVGSSLAGVTPLTPQGNIGAILGNTVPFSFKFTVPISGWSDYGVIVGSFAGLEKCANDYECTDTFSAQISSTGVVSNENVDWINGSCVISGTGTASVETCTLNTNLKDGTSALSSGMNCVAIGANGTAGAGERSFAISSSTTTSVVVKEFLPSSNGFITVDQPISIKCQKGSQDYKPKTAKVASSNGVPTVPGLTGSSAVSVDTFSFSYGGASASTVCSANPCTIYTQIGTAVSSVGWTAGPTYTANFSKTYSIINCIVQPYNSTTNAMSTTTLKGTATNNLSWSSTIHSSGSGANTYGTLICQGTY